MPKKNHLIPFRFLPASWGLEGRSYDEAEAHYNLSGEELDLRLLEISHPDSNSLDYRRAHLEILRSNGKIAPYDYASAKACLDNKGIVDPLAQAGIDLTFGTITRYAYDILKVELAGNSPLERAAVEYQHGKLTPYEYDIQVASWEDGTGVLGAHERLAIDLKYNKITQYEHDVAASELDVYMNDIEKQIAILHLNFKHKKIEKPAFDKELATIKGEPYITVHDSPYDPELGTSGIYFQFDWNDLWIDLLRNSGYVGNTDIDLVEQWFSDLCRSNANEVYDVDPPPFNSSRPIRRQGL
jgi:hypothetical protein